MLDMYQAPDLNTCTASPAGYDVSPWRETLQQLGQTKVFFSTTGALPYKSKYDTRTSKKFPSQVKQTLKRMEWCFRMRSMPLTLRATSFYSESQLQHRLNPGGYFEAAN